MQAAIGSADRLAAVQRSALLDTPSEEPFDALTRLAAMLLRAPASLVSIVDSQRDLYKNQIGFPAELAAAPRHRSGSPPRSAC